MVERITDPHKPVRIHGTGRIPDGQGVPQPPRPAQPPVSRRQKVYGWLCVAVAAGAVVGRALTS